MPDKLAPSYVQHTFPLRFDLWRDVFLKGAHCVTPAPRHWPPPCLPSKIKNRNRLHMWIGEHEVCQLDPQAVALYLDIDGNITETGGSNFVIYRDGQVVSPRRNNILWGVSLTVLAEILPGRPARTPGMADGR
jgi:branched-subunit amino acid aminotransferase/4-amino-4-deoxychorismate lyase